MRPVQKTISPGASILAIDDDRFKTARITAAFLLPLREETASANAILPFLLRRSSVDYPSFSQLQRRLNQLYGAKISADVYRIGYYQAMSITAASIDNRFALYGEDVTDKLAELLCSMIFNPVMENGRFPAADTEQEKRCLAELIKSEINEKRLYARRRCEQILCEGEGYAVNRYGSIENVDALNPKSVADAWRNMLKTAQVRIISQCAAGSEKIARQFERGLGSVEGRVPIALDQKPRRDVGEVRDVTERMGVSQAKLVLGFRAVGEARDDIPAFRLMNALLGGTPHSLLFKNVREKLSLCYYCASSYDRLGGVLLIDSGVEQKNAKLAQDEILRQLDAICRGDFTEQEIESAKKSAVNQYKTVGDLQSTLANWYIGQSLDPEISTPEQAAAEILDVTPERVIKAARSVRLGAVYTLAGEGEENE